MEKTDFFFEVLRYSHNFRDILLGRFQTEYFNFSSVARSKRSSRGLHLEITFATSKCLQNRRLFFLSLSEIKLHNSSSEKVVLLKMSLMFVFMLKNIRI